MKNNEEQVQSLFGISLSIRPKWQQFLICSSGFFFGYLVNGVCEELMEGFFRRRDLRDLKRYKVLDPRTFHYLHQSNSYQTDGLDESKEYFATKNAMDVVGINFEEQMLLVESFVFLDSNKYGHVSKNKMVLAIEETTSGGLSNSDGEPFIDGKVVPMNPKYREEWIRNNARANERNMRNDRSCFLITYFVAWGFETKQQFKSDILILINLGTSELSTARGCHNKWNTNYSILQPPRTTDSIDHYAPWFVV
ncbi:hypothetical protein L6452_05031 [Arctium lappa]|uniref:Uncharacterized protein n=1 Tax=Arctium lappa TaxID=4217 RepID=A0ACB9EF97_ARCLA|nr:hypothetical protein L6452_05031 [Arctium lappa]